MKVPVVQWPSGINILPTQEKNNYTHATGGYKVFVIPFSGATEGAYTIMPIQFSYFDTINNRLNTITNRSIRFYIRKTGNRDTTTSPVMNNINHDDTRNALMIGGGVVLALLLLLLFIKKRNKEKTRNYRLSAAVAGKHYQSTTSASKRDAIDDFLRPAADLRHYGGNTFYHSLKQGIARFFEQRFGLPAVLFNTTSLKQSLTENNVAAPLQEEVLNLLTEIEMNIYSGGGLDADKNNLLRKAKSILNRL